MAPSPEEPPEEDTVVGDKMDEKEPELMEDSELVKTHIIMHFSSNGGVKTNVGFLLKEVFKWLKDVCPKLYLETVNSEWKTIENVDTASQRKSRIFSSALPRQTLGAAVVRSSKSGNAPISPPNTSTIPNNSKSKIPNFGRMDKFCCLTCINPFSSQQMPWISPSPTKRTA